MAVQACSTNVVPDPRLSGGPRPEETSIGLPAESQDERSRSPWATAPRPAGAAEEEVNPTISHRRYSRGAAAFDHETLGEGADPAVDPATTARHGDEQRFTATRREIVIRQLGDIDIRLRSMTPEMRADDRALKTRKLLLEQELTGLEFREPLETADRQRLEFERRLRSTRPGEDGGTRGFGATGFSVR
jgi:hypothetical protein